MAQCEKRLPNGERCSNPAVPGTPLCEKHRSHIRFRAVQQPEPAPEPSASVAHAQPSAVGQAPAFPGLRVDPRNILVASQAIIFLTAAPGEAPAQPFSRLVRLLGLLSQMLELPGQASLYRRGETDAVLVHLLPAATEEEKLSALYDGIAWAAELVGTLLYIGQHGEFIQYRDANAPRGYDMAALSRREEGDQQHVLRLVSTRGCHEIPLAEFSEWPLADILLRIDPLPDGAGAIPERIYALTPPPLQALLARYCYAHHLHYRLVQLKNDALGTLLLFELSPRPSAPTGHGIPPFVLDYLTRLPRVSLLRMAYQTETQCILLQWRHRYPLQLPQVAAAFPADELVLLMTAPYANLRINPAPDFFDGDLLTRIHHQPQPVPLTLVPQPMKPPAALQLPVQLRNTTGPTPPIAAVILTMQELTWLRALLYRIPGEAFRAWTLCIGQDNAVLVGGTLPLEGVPFGLPLRRLGDMELFIPLRRRFVPELPQDILRRVLAIQEDRYTFFTDAYRLDVAVADFMPVAQVLLVDPSQPRLEFSLRKATAPPALHWTPGPSPEETSLVQRIWRKNKAKPQREAKEPATPQQDNQKQLLDQARAYEAAADYLAAAICYSLLHDPVSSARCYRRAAEAGSTSP